MTPTAWKIAILTLVGFGIFGGIVISQESEKIKVRKVRRVKRPKFTERDWDGIYFRDLFKEGLVGSRPSTIEAKPVVANPPGGQAGTSSGGGETTDQGEGWSGMIAAFIVEDEIKKIQRDLALQVTSPVKFRSNYGDARQSFAMLSMLFAVIRDYDGDIRWKRAAAEAQVAFARAAANARVGSQQAYQSAKSRKEGLDELVRGGNLTSNDEIPESLQWEAVVDRSPTMVKLEEAVTLLKPFFANKTEFVNNAETIEHEASLIAVIGEVLTREAMDDWDEDDYAQYARQMKQAAITVATSAQKSDFESASPAFNNLVQSCSNCHEEWR